jgi:hypothetical protein
MYAGSITNWGFKCLDLGYDLLSNGYKMIPKRSYLVNPEIALYKSRSRGQRRSSESRLQIDAKAITEAVMRTFLPVLPIGI